MVPVSLTTLREFFKAVPPSTVPQDLAVYLGRNTTTTDSNHAAGRKRGTANPAESRRFHQPPTQTTTPNLATQDPSHLSITSIESQNPPQEPTTVPLHPAARASDQPLPAPIDSLPTIHRTAGHAARGIGSQSDLALQLSPNATAEKNDEGVGTSWSPHLLFPEIDLALPQFEATALTLDTTVKRTGPQPTRGPNPNLTRRITRNKPKNSSDNNAALIDLDVRDFIDIPLQLAKGRELLTLIEAGSMPIPPDLLLPTHPQPTVREMGQTSKAKQKRKKPTSPTAQPTLKSSKQVACDPGPNSVPPVGPPCKSKPQQPMPQQGQCSTLQTHQSIQTQPLQLLIQKEIAPHPLSLLPETAPNICPDQEEDDPYLDRVDYSGDEDHT